MKYGPVKNFFNEAEKRTGKDRMTLLGWGCVPLVLLFGSTAVQLIFSLIATLYPAYSCLKAMVNKNTTEQLRWMEYWVVMSLLYVTDLFFCPLLSTYIPVFWLVKLSVLVWCIVPGINNGSKIIFGKVISPLYGKFGKQIEDYVCEVREAFVIEVAEVTTAVVEVMEEARGNVIEVAEALEEVTEDAIDSSKLLGKVVDVGSKITNKIDEGLALSAATC